MSSDTRDRNEGICFSRSLAEVSTCREVWKLFKTLEDVLKFVERGLLCFIPKYPQSPHLLHHATQLQQTIDISWHLWTIFHYVFWHGFIVSLRFTGLLHSRRISNAILQQRLLGTWHICLAPCDTTVASGPLKIGAAGSGPSCRSGLSVCGPDLTRPVFFVICVQGTAISKIDPTESSHKWRDGMSFDPMQCHVWSERSRLVVIQNFL